MVTDMEGVAGVARWEECRPAPRGRDTDYERSRELLTLEVAAAVEGAFAGGAEQVCVNDGHRGGGNFITKYLPKRGKYVIGKGKPRPVSGMDDSYDGLILLGYHSMSNSGGLLCHTMDPVTWDRYLINGRELGEMALIALAASAFDVPPLMVTGGSYACSEARRFFSDEVRTVQVKEDLSHESCISMAPEEAREAIRNAVKELVQSPPDTKPFTVDMPMKCRLELRTAEHAEESPISYTCRVDDRSFEYTASSVFELRPRVWK